MKTPISIADIVFFMIALTLCLLAIMGRISPEQFLTVVGTVFGAFYVHKANKQGKELADENSTSNN